MFLLAKYKMNRMELVAAIAEETKLTKKDALKAVDSFIKIVMDAVSGGDHVRLVGFGTFENKVRSARVGRNPMTGETLNIPAKHYPKFKASPIFKERVKGDPQI